MTRIKYSNLGSNCLVTDWFTIGPNLIVRGVIETTGFSIAVRGFDGEVHHLEFCKDLRTAKRKIRSKLIEFGVKLEHEIRQTTP